MISAASDRDRKAAMHCLPGCGPEGYILAERPDSSNNKQGLLVGQEAALSTCVDVIPARLTGPTVL